MLFRQLQKEREREKEKKKILDEVELSSAT